MTENELGDVVDMELREQPEKRWCVLFDEDYDDLLIDADDSVALLVDVNQATELMRLSMEIVQSLKTEQAPDEHPAELMIPALEELIEDND